MWGSSETLRERLAAAVPALVLGLAAGVTAGVLAAGALDTTPYGEAEFNTASRNAREAGQAQGWREAEAASTKVTADLKAANADHVARLEAKLARTRGVLEKRERSFKQVKSRADTREAELESSLAETTAALSNATSDGTAGGQTVEGTLRSTWVMNQQAKPWPKDCAKLLRTYQVRVVAGADSTVDSAELVDAELVRRNERKRTLTITCSMTYSASLPTPLGSGYQFVVESAGSGSPKARQHVPGASLSDGTGPSLSVSE